MTKMDTAKIDKLLEELDRIARDFNAYDYGLPLFNDDSLKDKPLGSLRRAVKEWWLKTNESN